VNFHVHAGEVVCLLGDNGAGKSTLVRVLSGAVRPDGGQLLVEGSGVEFDGPSHARSLGVETVYQDLALAPDLNSAENLYLGREIRARGVLGRLGFIDKRAMRKATQERFAQMGVSLPSVTEPVSSLSGGQKQIVAFGRASTQSGRVVILDEPTAALAVEPARRVRDVIRRIRDLGLGVVLVTHDLPGAFEVADRIVVMRLGRDVASLRTGECSMENLVALMTGAIESV
jgi:simple sugar transport system ATP-binding protein